MKKPYRQSADNTKASTSPAALLNRWVSAIEQCCLRYQELQQLLTSQGPLAHSCRPSSQFIGQCAVDELYGFCTTMQLTMFELTAQLPDRSNKFVFFDHLRQHVYRLEMLNEQAGRRLRLATGQPN